MQWFLLRVVQGFREFDDLIILNKVENRICVSFVCFKTILVRCACRVSRVPRARDSRDTREYLFSLKTNTTYTTSIFNLLQNYLINKLTS